MRVAAQSLTDNDIRMNSEYQIFKNKFLFRSRKMHVMQSNKFLDHYGDASLDDMGHHPFMALGVRIGVGITLCILAAVGFCILGAKVHAYVMRRMQGHRRHTPMQPDIQSPQTTARNAAQTAVRATSEATSAVAAAASANRSYGNALSML